MTKQYEVTDEVLGEIDDIIPRFIRNPVRSKIRLQYSYEYGARRLLVQYSYCTVLAFAAKQSYEYTCRAEALKGRHLCPARSAPWIIWKHYFLDAHA